jgi:hypothetical protein
VHTVAVLNYDGSLLAGCRPKRARKLLKAKRARPVRYKGSFAIRLNSKQMQNKSVRAYCHIPLKEVQKP